MLLRLCLKSLSHRYRDATAPNRVRQSMPPILPQQPRNLTVQGGRQGTTELGFNLNLAQPFVGNAAGRIPPVGGIAATRFKSLKSLKVNWPESERPHFWSGRIFLLILRLLKSAGGYIAAGRPFLFSAEFFIFPPHPSERISGPVCPRRFSQTIPASAFPPR